MNEVTVVIEPKPGDPLCACPFCNPLWSVADPNHVMKWIKYTPGSHLFRCDHCGALLVKPYGRR